MSVYVVLVFFGAKLPPNLIRGAAGRSLRICAPFFWGKSLGKQPAADGLAWFGRLVETKHGGF